MPIHSVRVLRSRKAFGWTLGAHNDRHGQELFTELRVRSNHGLSIGLCRFRRGVRRVSFLPQKFRGPQKRTGPHLPTHHVRPLIDFEWQITVTDDPFAEHVPYHGFRCGTDDEWIFQFGIGIGNETIVAAVVGFEAVVRHDGTFLGEAIHVFGFLGQEGFWNEQGKVRVLGAVVFDFGVQLVSNQIPDCHAPGLDDHATTDWRGFGQASDANNIIVPLRVIFGSSCNEIGLFLVAVVFFVAATLLRLLFRLLLVGCGLGC